MPTYVSKAAFARDRGVTRQSVHEWVNAYSIQLVDGKLDLDVARVQWDVHRKRRTARSGRDDSKGDRCCNHWPTRSMAPDPIPLHREPIELVRCVASGIVDEPTLAWLAEGFARHAAGEPLEHALRLDRANRIRQRDAALLRAADALGPTASTWALAGLLEAAVRRFRSRVWPRVRCAPVDLPPIDDALRVAFLAGERVPSSQRQLYALLL